MHKLLLDAHKTFGRKNASHRVRNVQNFIRWKVALFPPKQYWNQNKYFILISIDFHTRMCFFLLLPHFRCFDIPKLKSIAIFRSGVLPSKVFLLFFAFKKLEQNFA
jgi:hypothetical protein